MARKGQQDEAGSKNAPKVSKQGRVAQIRAAYKMTREVDRLVGWVTLAVGLLPFVLMLSIGFAVGQPIYLGLLGFTLGLLAASIVFSRRAERAVFARLDGETAAAAAAMSMLRRGWTVTPGVAVNRNQDIVHRAVGRAGVVLVGEGAPSRVNHLLANEKKKVARFVPDVPIYELQAGNEEGQVPLRKLNTKLMKLPKNLTSSQVSEVNRRLKALGTVNLPIPKGPLPKGLKLPKGPRP